MVSANERAHCTEFTVLDIKYRFTCDELNFCRNTLNCKDIMSVIVDSISLDWSIFRGCHQRCSVKKGVLKNFAIFAGKHVC